MAAVVVVIFHYGKELTFLPDVLFQGPEMVTFFFVLSGFVLTVSYSARSQFSYCDFILNRLARIAPVYFLALALVTYGKFLHGDLIATDLLLNIFFAQSWLPAHALSLNSPGWSISVEIFFYLAFPFIFSIVKKSERTSYSVFVFSVAFWIATQLINSALIYKFGEKNNFVSYFPLLHLTSFMLGISGGKLFLENKPIIRLLKKKKAFFSVTAFFALAIAMANKITDSTKYIETSSSFLSLLFLFFILSVAANNENLRFAHTKTMLLLGESSYALYIMQVPVYGIYKRTVLPFIDNATAAFFAYLSILIALSIIIYLFLETPTTKLIKTHANSHFLRHVRKKFS